MLSNFIKLTLTSIVIVFIAGCGVLDFETNKQVSSSLLDYLYPHGEHFEQSKQGQKHGAIPYLELPIRVGIAFVPLSSSYAHIDFSPSQQMKLLQEAKDRFTQYQFIEHIELIPANYLQARGGFTNLQQVANLYDVDLMALVSYDQVQKSYSKDLSLLYLTVVGAYIFEGDDNHTQTFVDTAVFDVQTETLLFRAPGTHKSRKNSTANGKSLVLDKMSQKSFTIAMESMLNNLDIELNSFRERVKNEKIAKISYKKSYSGGGTSGLLALFILFLISVMKMQTIKRYKD